MTCSMLKTTKPFLKWAGGKTQLLHDIEQRFPFSKGDEFTFIEPFVGSGAVLFWVLNHFPHVQRCIINDMNAELVNTYHVIKNDVGALIALLRKWELEYHQLAMDDDAKKLYYYDKRAYFNIKKASSVTLAALFIFLNKTCFNGLYRVNKKGGFNVPIGSYKTPLICHEGNLKLVSQTLQKVEILQGDFKQTLAYAQNNTVFYLDPPYKPLNTTSSFNAYAKGEFGDSEQIRLKSFCDALTKKGASWMLSNSDVNQFEQENTFFDELYCNYQIQRVLAKRSINAKASKRGHIHELLITNSCDDDFMIRG